MEKLSVDELLTLKKKIDGLILIKRENLQNSLGKRKSQRAKTRISGTAEIEREKEFFYQTHKIVINNMSVDGLTFTTTATVIEKDIISIGFRSPSSGEKKSFVCEVLRVAEQQNGSDFVYEVAARAVGMEEVKAYRDMLKNRGK